MNTLFNPGDLPDHLFNIAELDFSKDLFSDPLGDSWFNVGVLTLRPRRRDARGVEEEVFRQSLLLSPADFAKVFDGLNAIGNVIGGLGKPSASIMLDSEHQSYSYVAFHTFEFPF